MRKSIFFIFICLLTGFFPRAQNSATPKEPAQPPPVLLPKQDSGKAIAIKSEPISLKLTPRNDTGKGNFKHFQIGVAVGPDIVHFEFERNKKDTLSGITGLKANSTLGFHFGTALRFNFNRNLYLNSQPQFNFQGAYLSYNKNGIAATTHVAPTTLEIPVHFVLKSYGYVVNPACFLGLRYIGDKMA